MSVASKQKLPNVVRLDVENLDRAACNEFEANWQQEIGDAAQIVLDLESVQFADSVGLGLIRSLHSQVPHRKLVLANVSLRLKLCLERIPAEVRPRQFASLSEAIGSFTIRNPVEQANADT